MKQMNKLIALLTPVGLLVLGSLATGQAGGRVITVIIDETGDGAGNLLDGASGLATDSAGNVFVAGSVTHNAFRVAPDGQITQILDSAGDGLGNVVSHPQLVGVDGADNVYVGAMSSDNVFRITPGGQITQILDATGDGLGNTANNPSAIAFGDSGNVYVACSVTNNVFKIEPGGQITEILDSTGGGSGWNMSSPIDLSFDSAENLYVAVYFEDVVFRLLPGVPVPEVIEIPGLSGLYDLTVGPKDDLYAVGRFSDNAFEVATTGTITEIIDVWGDGAGRTMSDPRHIATDGSGNVYVLGTTGSWEGVVFKILALPGHGFCFGDPGSGTPCPCSNDNDGSVPGSGCDNGHFSSGALLQGFGVASVSDDTLVLSVTGQEPLRAGLYFQAENAINGADGIPFGDGLRCAGGALIRLQLRFADSAGASNTTIAIGAKGGVSAGQTKRYQHWYRSTNNPPCGPGVNDFNLSNGYEITWLP